MPSGSMAGQLQGTGSLAGQLPGGGASSSISAPLNLTLSDATTNTAPLVLLIKHTTSGVAAVNFGVMSAVDLQSAAGNIRRVLTETTLLTVATDGAEESRQDVRTMVAGALTMTVSFGVDQAIKTPMLFLGDPTGGNGVRLSAANRVDLVVNNSTYIQCSGGSVAIAVPVTVTGKVLSSDSMKQGTALTDAALSKDVSNGAEFTLPASTLTTGRVLTLNATGGPITGQVIRVTRLDVTVSIYTVKDDAATTLLIFPGSARSAADFKYNGTHFVLDRYWLLN